MNNPINIAYLAGVFDGEGCVQVQRSKRKARGGGTRVVSSILLTIVNTSTPLIEKCISVLAENGVSAKIYNELKYGTRPIFFLRVAKKREVLILARLLLPYAIAKKSELQMAIWYLDRSCAARQHVATAQDVEVLDTISAVKHGGKIPASVRRLIDN